MPTLLPDSPSITSPTFDAEGQVVRSPQTVEEETQLAEQGRGEAVTVGNGRANAQADTAATKSSCWRAEPWDRQGPRARRPALQLGCE